MEVLWDIEAREFGEGGDVEEVSVGGGLVFCEDCADGLEDLVRLLEQEEEEERRREGTL